MPKEIPPGLETCPDCGVFPGKEHKENCDVERCSACGNQRLQCRCRSHDKKFARWNGIWPGEAESKLLGITLNDLYTHNYYKIFFMKPK